MSHAVHVRLVNPEIGQRCSPRAISGFPQIGPVATYLTTKDVAPVHAARLSALIAKYPKREHHEVARYTSCVSDAVNLMVIRERLAFVSFLLNNAFARVF